MTYDGKHPKREARDMMNKSIGSWKKGKECGSVWSIESPRFGFEEAVDLSALGWWKGCI